MRVSSSRIASKQSSGSIPLYRCMFQWANARSTGFRRRISKLIFGLSIPNPLHCRFVIHVTRCAITCDSREGNRRIMLVQFLIVGLGNKHCVVIEKMDFLLIPHAYVRDICSKSNAALSAGLLRAEPEIKSTLNFATFGPKHQRNVHRESHRGS